jgi:hypothetical protein
LKVALGKFAQSGIETEHGEDVAGAVERGLLHYTRRLRSGWTPAGIPSFALNAPLSPTDEFEVRVGSDTEAVLEYEARRQQVPMQLLVRHAVLTYMADVDSLFAGAPRV